MVAIWSPVGGGRKASWPISARLPCIYRFLDRSPSLVQIPSLLPNAICPRGKANCAKVTKASFRFQVQNPMFGLA